MNENHHTKMDVLIDNLRPALHKVLDKAMSSGAVEDEMVETDDFTLVKCVLTAYMRTEPYGPWNSRTRETVKNLEHFI